MAKELKRRDLKYLGFKYDEEVFRFIECNDDER